MVVDRRLAPILVPSSLDALAPIYRPRRFAQETWPQPAPVLQASPGRARLVTPAAATVRESAARRVAPVRPAAALGPVTELGPAMRREPARLPDSRAGSRIPGP